MSGDWPPDTREKAAERSEGRCERCGLHRAQHLHHRLLRGYGNHEVSNALHVCLSCHEDIHSEPDWSYRHGWLIKCGCQHDALTRGGCVCDPSKTIVVYRGEKVRLAPDGWILLQPVA